MVKFENPTELRCERMEVSADDGKKPHQNKIHGNWERLIPTQSADEIIQNWVITIWKISHIGHFIQKRSMETALPETKKAGWKKMQCQKEFSSG